MPLPMMTPQRNGSSLAKSMPLSLTASSAATSANCAKRSSRRTSLASSDGFRVEVLDLAAEVDLEGGGVELLDRADAAPAGQQRLPERRHVHGERVDRPHAGDDDAPPVISCSISRSM